MNDYLLALMKLCKEDPRIPGFSSITVYPDLRLLLHYHHGLRAFGSIEDLEFWLANSQKEAK